MSYYPSLIRIDCVRYILSTVTLNALEDKKYPYISFCWSHHPLLCVLGNLSGAYVWRTAFLVIISKALDLDFSAGPVHYVGFKSFEISSWTINIYKEW